VCERVSTMALGKTLSETLQESSDWTSPLSPLLTAARQYTLLCKDPRAAKAATQASHDNEVLADSKATRFVKLAPSSIRTAYRHTPVLIQMQSSSDHEGGRAGFALVQYKQIRQRHDSYKKH